MSKDPKDFGPVPEVNKKFKAPEKFPSDKTAMLGLVEAKGGFPVRAARWLAPREVRALLLDEYPLESSNILAIRTPRKIANADDLLTLTADRRVAYTIELKEREAKKAKAPTKPKAKPKPEMVTAGEPTLAAALAKAEAEEPTTAKAEA